MIEERKVLMGKKTGKDRKEIKDADRIIALALLKHLYNNGEISECVFRKIKKSTMEKVSLKIVNLYDNINT